MGYTDYTANMYKSCGGTVPWKLMIVATDEAAHTTLASRGIPSVVYPLNPCPPDYVNYLDPRFKLLSFSKFDLLAALIRDCRYSRMADHIVYLDGDVWVQRDFSDELTPYKQADVDVTFQCDEGTLEVCDKPCKNMCTGFMMLKVNSSPLLDQFLDYRSFPGWHQYKNDQDYSYYAIPSIGLKYNTFDRTVFPNGYHVKENSIPNNYALIHYNWLIGDEKRAAMIANGHFSFSAVTP
jgi:hypothetical protein